MKELEWKKDDSQREFTPEECAAYEEGYQHFAQIADAYERLIALEDDPWRKEVLEKLANQHMEDNK